MVSRAEAIAVIRKIAETDVPRASELAGRLAYTTDQQLESCHQGVDIAGFLDSLYNAKLGHLKELTRAGGSMQCCEQQPTVLGQRPTEVGKKRTQCQSTESSIKRTQVGQRSVESATKQAKLGNQPAKAITRWAPPQQPFADNSKQLPQIKLWLERKLCDGCHGSVLVGTCDGVRAAIKLLGPSETGMAAGRRECRALKHLSAANVSAAAKFLYSGHIGAGVHFVATEWVSGRPLSRVRTITPDIAAAAVRTLQEVHAAHPNLLHGDIRLDNIMLVQSQPTGEGCSSISWTTAPVCRLIDFGSSSFDGDQASQDEEVRQLQELLMPAS